MDIAPVVVKGKRRGNVGTLLGGGIPAAVLGVGAIWQAVTNHIETSSKTGQMYYLPTPLRVVMFIFGAALCLFAALAFLVAATQVRKRPSINLSAGGFRFDSPDAASVRIGWTEVAAVTVRDGGEAGVDLLFRPANPGFASRHRGLTERDGWYALTLGRRDNLAAELAAGVRKFHPLG